MLFFYTVVLYILLGSTQALAQQTCANGAQMGDTINMPNQGIRATINTPIDNGGHQYNIIEYMSNLTGIELGFQDWSDGYCMPEVTLLVKALGGKSDSI